MKNLYLVLLLIISVGYSSIPVAFTIHYSIEGGIPSDNTQDILRVYMNGILLSTDNGLSEEILPHPYCFFQFQGALSSPGGTEVYDLLTAGGELTFTLESVNDDTDEELLMSNQPFIIYPGQGLQNLGLQEMLFISDNIEEWCEDANEDGYDDVSYEAGYIAGHSDGVVFGMESVDITIDNQAVCVDCYADGEASVDTNSDGLVDEFPVITILGEDVLILTQTSDEEYTDEGATCYAGETNLYSSVEVSGQVVNMSNIGTYIITYNCSDTEGNQAMSKSRTVIVQADYSDEDDDGYDDVSYDAGAESGDLNLDGVDDVLDVVILVNNILNP